MNEQIELNWSEIVKLPFETTPALTTQPVLLPATPELLTQPV